MKSLIAFAYSIDPRLIAGPTWVLDGEETFTVRAVSPVGATRDQVRGMLQVLLRERFHLSVHRAAFEQSGYVLAAGKSGSKLKSAGSIDESACRLAPGKMARAHHPAAITSADSTGSR